MTHIFGGIRCYARATAFCSGVLVATKTVQKTITLATPTSTSTVTSTSTSDPLRPAVAQQPLITSAPSLHKRDLTSSDDAAVDQESQDQIDDDEDFEDEEYDIGLYNPFNCPAPDALAARADIKLACACLMNRGPSTVTLTETSTVTPAVVVVVATAAPMASTPKKTPAAAAAVKGEKKQKPKQKTPPVKIDAPLRKGVYGTREKDLRPFGDDAEPVPFWDKDDGFDHRGY